MKCIWYNYIMTKKYIERAEADFGLIRNGNAGAVDFDRSVEGVVEMMLDATQRCFAPLTADKLLGWHAALFPTRRSGM